MPTKTETVTTRPIKLKDGTTIPAGAVVTEWCEDRPHLCRLEGGKLVRITSAFTAPTAEALEEMLEDMCSCETVTGDCVEPDGRGPDGAPSWLLAMGLI